MLHPFDYLETDFSVTKLVQSVDIVASPYGVDELLFKSAVSRLVLMVSYSVFFADVCEFFEYLFIDGVEKGEDFSEDWGESFQLYDTLVVLIKSWNRLSKSVYENEVVFELINGEWLTLEELSNCLTLINSKKEERVVADLSKLVAKNHLGDLRHSNVSSLRRDASCRNLVVKVLTAGNVLFEDGRSLVTGKKSSIANFRMSEFLVGDSTGCIMFIARNEQVDVLKPGLVVLLKNARTEFYDRLCLSVRDGSIEVVDNVGGFIVKEDKIIY